MRSVYRVSRAEDRIITADSFNRVYFRLLDVAPHIWDLSRQNDKKLKLEFSYEVQSRTKELEIIGIIGKEGYILSLECWE